MSSDWLRPRPLRGGDWSAMTGSPPLRHETGVLLVPIIADGSTERKELEYGVLRLE